MVERHTPDPVSFKRMDTTETRNFFLIDTLFQPDKIEMVYWHTDRAIVGGVVPLKKTLKLEASKEMASDYFTQRREIGVINAGDAGVIIVDKKKYTMAFRDALYIGRGSKDITFSSNDPKKPAYFYFLSFPAHKEYPTTHAKISGAEPLKLGSLEDSNKRTIYKYIHPAGIKSCQLVMGLTELDPGSVWNTMTAHTHARRCEIYMYFALSDDARVFHFMGEPNETRHLVMKNREVVLSPSWSIHAGSGTKNYMFVWAMGGENQDFGDMDAVKMDVLK